MSFRKDLGAVSSYALAVEAGYEGTEEEFAAEQAQFAANAKLVAEAKTAAETAKEGAEDAKTAAENAETEAKTAANKAAEAQTAAEAAKDNAMQSAENAENNKNEVAALADLTAENAAKANTYATAAQSSEKNALNASEAAINAQDAAKQSEENAATHESSAKTYSESAEESADKAAAAAIHQPVIQSGTWWLWDFEKGEYVDSGVSVRPEDAVLYVAQDKTEEEKKQARDNIGAIKSWDELENKPFGEETGVVEIWPETFFTIAEGSDRVEFSDPISVRNGITYIVEYNGVAYECVAATLTSYGITSTVLGDTTGQGFVNGNGEPFGIMVLTEEDANMMGITFQFIPKDGATKGTFYIYQQSTVITPLPGKYLPTGTPWIVEGEKTYIVPETTIQFENGESMINMLVPFVVGETYIVTWNGVEYSCVAQDASSVFGAGAVGVGDGTMYGLAGNGEPFVIGAVPAQGATILGALDGSTEVVGSIHQGGDTVHKLDNRCLDLAWLPIIIEGAALFPRQTIMGGDALPDFAFTADQVGKTFVVELDGVSYDCVLAQFLVGEEQWLCLGNLSLMGADADTGEPFLIVTTPIGVTFWESPANGQDFELAIYGEGYNKIPEGFLPPMPEVNTNIVNADGEGSLRSILALEPDGDTTRYGVGAVAFGKNSRANGDCAFAYGEDCRADWNYSFAGGKNSYVTANGAAGIGMGINVQENASFIHGKYNLHSMEYAHVVGNGTEGNRSDAYTLDWDGNAWFAGDIEAKNALILASPNGTRYKITVSDDGTLSATAI